MFSPFGPFLTNVRTRASNRSQNGLERTVGTESSVYGGTGELYEGPRNTQGLGFWGNQERLVVGNPINNQENR